MIWLSWAQHPRSVWLQIDDCVMYKSVKSACIRDCQELQHDLIQLCMAKQQHPQTGSCTEEGISISLQQLKWLQIDDCVMYKSVKSACIRDCQELQHDLIQLYAWQKRLQLRFNPRICNVMRSTHATRKNRVPCIHPWWDSPHGYIQYQLYLGVELTSDLRWNKQVKKTVAKGNQTLGVLKKNLN